MHWSETYKDLAELLLAFQRAHFADPGRELYNRCLNQKNFQEDHRWMLRMRYRNNSKSLDPIHFFTSFNEYKLSDEQRKRKILAWYRIFYVRRDIDKIDFTGCPSPISIKLLSVRSENEQAEIWDLFKSVMEQQQEALSENIFKIAKKWYGVDIPSLTIFLFWINSNNFLPLDKNTMRVLKMAQLAEAKIDRFGQYKDLIRFPNSPLYLEIAEKAVLLLEDEMAMEKYCRELNNRYFSRRRQFVPANIDFRLVGLKLLAGTLKQYQKILEIGKPYCFYNKFSILKNGSVRVQSLSDTRLYSQEKVEINISAIVGKNGSGKSTITELLYAIIYNISCEFIPEYVALKPLKGLNAELYYLGDNLYKIQVLNGKVKIHRYRKKNAGYEDPILVRKTDFKLDQFFYTIAINYSQYGLNELYMGSWIHNLFHKNDGYQVPITLNPFREKGIIDINKENELVMARLVANILEPVSADVGDNMRIITEDKRFAKRIRFTINKIKKDVINEEKKDWIPGNQEFTLRMVYSFFKLKIRKVNPALRRIADDYIYRKLLKIPAQYPTLFGRFDSPEGWNASKQEILGQYLTAISHEPSHVTYKIKQAINFLLHDKLFKISLNAFRSVETLSGTIDDIKREIGDGNEARTIEFIPPSFLKAEIQLNDGSDFKDLSSGEKQRIYAASSLVYHLGNLNSVVSRSLVCYSNINVIFDEIELYFHPDMQRTFLTYLLAYLDRVGFQNITGINFCFVTHSPFILSDIPSDNILFLEKKGDKQRKVKLKTFGANIHELLMDGFFMDQTLGGFAITQIQDIQNFHGKLMLADNLDDFKKTYAIKKNKFYFVRDNLGETYIANIVKNHIEEIEETLEEDEFLNWQISKFEEQILQLKTKKNAQGKLSSTKR